MKLKKTDKDKKFNDVLTPPARSLRDGIISEVERIVNKNVKNIEINERIHRQLEKIYPKEKFIL